MRVLHFSCIVSNKPILYPKCINIYESPLAAGKKNFLTWVFPILNSSCPIIRQDFFSKINISVGLILTTFEHDFTAVTIRITWVKVGEYPSVMLDLF